MAAAVASLKAVIMKRDPDQKEFQQVACTWVFMRANPMSQAAFEVLDTLAPVFEKDPKYVKVMERLIEPERAIQFRVAWMNDKHEECINRGIRIQYNCSRPIQEWPEVGTIFAVLHLNFFCFPLQVSPNSLPEHPQVSGL